MISTADPISPEEYVYLDYAATAPLCEEAARALEPFIISGRNAPFVQMNANSLHRPGRKAFSAMEDARRSFAKSVGARRPQEIIFTSGATESDNAAIIGLGSGKLSQRVKQGKVPETPTVISSEMEHPAILETLGICEKAGWRVVLLKPDKNGRISSEKLSEAIDESVLLVSIQYANSEIGIIQPIEELASIAHSAGALFHTDATQALGKVPVYAHDSGVDAMSFSGHKIGAPKGIGALYLRFRIPFISVMRGGGQEDKRRSGTQNVAGIVAFAAAAEAAVALQAQESKRLAALRDRLYRELGGMSGVVLTCPEALGSEGFLPNIVHICVEGMESESLIQRLDSLGFGVSGGSACSSGSLKASPVLLSMGMRESLALGALRISMGRYTKEDDADRFIAALRSVLEKG